MARDLSRREVRDNNKLARSAAEAALARVTRAARSQLRRLLELSDGRLVRPA